MQRAYNKWFSPALQRDMELLVFGHAGTPVLLFPTRTARFYDYEDWKIIEALRPKIDNGFLQVICVDSIDIESFYSRLHPADKIRRHQHYEHYIIYEVLPYIRYLNRLPGIIAAGCSLGGYHAANIAFKYPQHFIKMVSMSARFDLTLSSHKFPDLFYGYTDENIYYNMPGMYIPHLYNEHILQQLRTMQITLVVGLEDPFYDNNRHMEGALRAKGIHPQFFVWDGEAHRPRYWRQMVELYL